MIINDTMTDQEKLECKDAILSFKTNYATGGFIKEEDFEQMLKTSMEAEGYTLTHKQIKKFNEIIEILNNIYAGKYKK